MVDEKGKENISSTTAQERMEERLRRLEEFKRAKQEKKNADNTKRVTVASKPAPHKSRIGHKSRCNSILVPPVEKKFLEPIETMAVTNKTSINVPTPSVSPHNCRIIIDWTRPVYLKHNKQYYRISRPHLQLFRLSQIQSCVEKDKTDLARLMLAVVGTDGQSKVLDARNRVKYWEILISLNQSGQARIVNEAMRFLTMQQVIAIAPSAAPKLDSLPTIHTPGSPTTPEVTFLSKYSPLLRTPELYDEETRKMQAEIEDVVRRTPAIQENISERAQLIEKALTTIKDTSLYHGKFAKRPNRAIQDGIDGGSAYLYAMITPSKRLKSILDSEAVVSPVRRSKRLLQKDSVKRQLFETVDDIPDLAVCGFVPNIEVTKALSSFGIRRQQPKADIGKESQSKAGTASEGDKSPFH